MGTHARTHLHLVGSNNECKFGFGYEKEEPYDQTELEDLGGSEGQKDVITKELGKVHTKVCVCMWCDERVREEHQFGVSQLPSNLPTPLLFVSRAKITTE